MTKTFDEMFDRLLAETNITPPLQQGQTGQQGQQGQTGQQQAGQTQQNQNQNQLFTALQTLIASSPQFAKDIGDLLKKHGSTTTTTTPPTAGKPQSSTSLVPPVTTPTSQPSP
jgi:hypothetical protein